MDPTRRKSLRFEFEFVRHFLVFDIGVSPNSSHYSQILSTKPGMPCKEWKLNGSTTRFEHFNAYAESDVGLCKVVTEQHDDSNVNGWHLLQQRAVHHEHFRPRQICTTSTGAEIHRDNCLSLLWAQTHSFFLRVWRSFQGCAEPSIDTYPVVSYLRPKHHHDLHKRAGHEMLLKTVESNVEHSFPVYSLKRECRNAHGLSGGIAAVQRRFSLIRCPSLRPGSTLCDQ